MSTANRFTTLLTSIRSRRPTEARHSAGCRTRLYAEETGLKPGRFAPVLVQAKRLATKELGTLGGLITHLAEHLVEHYGIDEVARWYFEIWNEPNIDFWNGIPRQESYFELYDHTARDLKAVNSRLRVGGPATAAAQWVPEFLRHTAENHVSVDFVSAHGYADDTAENLFGPNHNVPMDERVCRAIEKVRGRDQGVRCPKLPLFWTEWNVPGMLEARDTSFVGPALANTIRACDGMVEMLSFWTFSDVFEEGGPIPKPFEGHFGLRAEYGINKPSFYDFALLHTLGDQRLANSSRNVIVTKRPDGTLVIAVWNLVDPDQKGASWTVTLKFSHLPGDADCQLCARWTLQHSERFFAEYKRARQPDISQ